MTSPHPAATTSRQVPEDLRMHRYHRGYVVTVCEGPERAERIVGALADAGFEREEIVLVSHDVDSIGSPWPGEDSLQVADPASLGVRTEETAWGITGAATGALVGVTATYLADLGIEGEWLRVLLGALVGGLVGAVAGWLGYRAFRREPVAFYDAELSGQQVLAGIGLLHADDRERAERAAAALSAIDARVISLAEHPRRRPR